MSDMDKTKAQLIEEIQLLRDIINDKAPAVENGVQADAETISKTLDTLYRYGPDIYLYLDSQKVVISYGGDTNHEFLTKTNIIGEPLSMVVPDTVCESVTKAIDQAISVNYRLTVDAMFPQFLGGSLVEVKVIPFSNQTCVILFSRVKPVQYSALDAGPPQQVQDLIDTFRNGVMIMLTPKIVLSTNQNAAVFLNTTPESLKTNGLNLEKLIIVKKDGSIFPLDEFPLVKAFQDGKPLYNVIAGIYDTEKETYRWLTIYAYPKFKGTNPKPIYCIFTLSDMTEIIKIEDKLIVQADLIDQLREPVAILDMSQNVRLWNKAAEKLLGYTENQVVGRKFTDVTHYFSVQSETIGSLFAGIANKGEWKGESIWFNKKGSALLIETYCSVVNDRFGNPTSIFIVGRDITERRRQEQALMDSENRFRTIAGSDLVSIVITQNSRIVYVSPGMENLLGYSSEEFKNINYYEILHPDSLEQFAEIQVKFYIKKDYSPMRVEFAVKSKSGEMRWIDCSIGSIVLYDQPAIIGVIVDVTEQHRAQDALRNTERQYRVLAESAQDSIVHIDLNMKVQYVNQFGASLFGKNQGYFVGKSLDEIFPPFLSKQISRDINAIIKSQKHEYKEYSNNVKDKVIWMGINISPIEDNNGEIIGVIAIGRDITERRQQEQALIESENRFRTIAGSDLVSIVISQDSKIVYASPGMEKLLGYTAEEFKNIDYYDLLSPESKSVIKELENEFYEKGNNAHDRFEFAIRSKSGVYHWVDCSIGTIKYNEKPAVIAVLVDITEQRLARETLRQREEQYRILAESAPESISYLDMDMKIQYINNYGANLLHNPPEFFVGKTIDALFPANLVKQIYLDLETVITSKQVAYREYTNPSDVNENWIGVSISPVEDSDGKIIGVLCIGRDITERIKLENALKESEASVRKIWDQINQPMVVVDVIEDGSYRYSGINLNQLKLVNSTADKFLGKTPFDIQSKEKADMDIEQYDIVVRTGEPNTYEREGVFQGEESNWVASITPVKDDKGNVVKLIVLGTNITERAKQEQRRLELERKIAEAQRVESLGMLAGGIAHDFNNLLTAMLGHAELASGELSEDSPVKNTIEKIQIAATRAAELTSALLAYSGKSNVEREPIDINKLIMEIAEITKSSISKYAEMRFHFEQDLPLILADISQIRQVFLNLIINASEAIKNKQGLIEIKSSEVTLNEQPSNMVIDFTSFIPGKYVSVSVYDNGEGMTLSDTLKIFDPFYTTKPNGSGLGLAAVAGIIKAHNGAIQLATKYHHGTTFTVFLPVSTNKKNKTVKVADKPQSLDVKGTALLIDDDDGARFVTSKMLQRIGFAVKEFDRGSSAIEEFKLNPTAYACAFIDIRMPEMSGDLVFEALRGINSSIPVAFMSGYDEQQAVADMQNQPATVFLQKPFTMDDIRNALNRILIK